jgi:hypothetical protein
MRHYHFIIVELTAVIFAFAVARLFPAAAAAAAGASAAPLASDDNTRKQNRNISTDLFQDLEELSTLVDISYCVGSTGIHRPFKCLSHCSEFSGFELVTVSELPPKWRDYVYTYK